MMAYASVSIANNVLEYQEYPVVTSINSVYESEPQFPAVEFCNFESINAIKNCSFEGTECNPINLMIRNKDCNTFNWGLEKNISYYYLVVPP